MMGRNGDDDCIQQSFVYIYIERERDDDMYRVGNVICA